MDSFFISKLWHVLQSNDDSDNHYTLISTKCHVYCYKKLQKSYKTATKLQKVPTALMQYFIWSEGKSGKIIGISDPSVT